VLAAIEWDKIGQLLWVAPVAGLAVAVSFALLIAGLARADDCRRAGSGAAAAAYTALAALGGLAFVGVFVFGLDIIINK
jgi:uncharacterized membrane protein